MIFQETQRFRQWWLWLILLGIEGMVMYGTYQQYIVGTPFGNQPNSDSWLVFAALIISTISMGVFVIGLHTTVDQHGISFRWSPFSQRARHIPWSDVVDITVSPHHFVGYGLRFSQTYGTVHNVSGRYGLQLMLDDGSKYLIGTQKPEELQSFLQKIQIDFK